MRSVERHTAISVRCATPLSQPPLHRVTLLLLLVLAACFSSPTAAPDGGHLRGADAGPSGPSGPSGTGYGFVVAAPPGRIVEHGPSVRFSVALAAAPAASVAVGVSSSDTTEVSVSPTSLNFTPSNWSVPQTVAVTAIDNWRVDGSRIVSILLTGLGSSTAVELSIADDDTGSGYRIRSTYAEGSPFYVAHSYYHSIIASLTDTKIKQPPGDFEWRIVPGLANPSDPSLVSIVSPTFPGQYLHIDSARLDRYPSEGERSTYNIEAFWTPAVERNHLVWLDPRADTDAFRRDATFRIVRARNGDASMISFQWYGDPTRYLRHQNYQLYARVLDGSATQDASASFTLEPLGFLVARRADPHITHHTDGFYYLAASVPEYDRIELSRATTLRGLATAEPTVIWKKHEAGVMSAHVWAPELHSIEGKWYVYFAADSSTNDWAHRMYVLESSAANPMDGPWIERGQITTAWDTFSLDATTFEHGGAHYLLWAQEDPSVEGDSSSLFIAAMSNPWTITGAPVRIAKPEYAWEKMGYSVNEGPAVIVRNGRVFVSYSASATDDRYCLGLLTASATSDLLSASSWTKAAMPVFTSGNGLWGPGHNSFTTAREGSVDVLVYHARSYQAIDGDPLNDGNRHTRIQRLSWNGDGTPSFGTPLVNGFDTIGE